MLDRLRRIERHLRLTLRAHGALVELGGDLVVRRVIALLARRSTTRDDVLADLRDRELGLEHRRERRRHGLAHLIFQLHLRGLIVRDRQAEYRDQRIGKLLRLRVTRAARIELGLVREPGREARPQLGVSGGIGIVGEIELGEQAVEAIATTEVVQREKQLARELVGIAFDGPRLEDLGGELLERSDLGGGECGHGRS